MIPKVHLFAVVVLFAVANSELAIGQPLSPTTLVIEVKDVVEYQADIPDPARYAINPNATPSNTPRNFAAVTLLGDIVAVNGEPAKGLYVGRSRGLNASPAPSPGGAIADVTRTALREQVFEILKNDSTPVGTLVSLGFSGGPPPPGTASTERANWAIIGGTGAYLGARGQVSGTGGVARAASMEEDPANRRINGGVAIRFILHVIPMTVPQIVATPVGPALAHSSDFTLVNGSHPAAPGEILSIFAKGLGPTIPAVELGQNFPPNSLTTVTSPIAVTVNGRPAEVLTANGFPGAVDGYQVNFRVPADAAKGEAAVQVSAAWVASSAVGIVIQ